MNLWWSDCAWEDIAQAAGEDHIVVFSVGVRRVFRQHGEAVERLRALPPSGDSKEVVAPWQYA